MKQSRRRPALAALAGPILALAFLSAAPVRHVAQTPAQAAAPPAATPSQRTMRVDYFHTGNASQELFSLDRVVIEPAPWPGNPDRPLDDTNSGVYLFEVRDAATNRLLYSRGFSSIYGEWETTAEARRLNRTFGESLRFPEPRGPVQVSVRKRDPETSLFREVWTLALDPADPIVDTARPLSPGPVIELQRRGDPARKLDLLVLGDGYVEGERGKFEGDARRLLDVLFTVSPFRERRDDINVWGICPPSPESGISRPSTGVHHASRIGATYDAFGSERYILTFDNRSFREVASFAPYEAVAILVNGNTYGGGGIFNLYTTVAADSAWAPYIFVHELGHHLAGLADEYFTSETAYLPPNELPEPWEPNATALKDPAGLKWRDLVTAGVPLPTPWDEKTFMAREDELQKRRRQIRAERRPEAEMDALFREEKAWMTSFLAGQEHRGEVGAFEGASYQAAGLYRPQLDCIMFSRDDVPFCAVCRRALSRILDLATRGRDRV